MALTESDIRERFPGNAYVAYHAPRYRLLLSIVDKHAAKGPPRLLDVGPSALTDLIRQEHGIAVDTLGFSHSSFSHSGKHYQMDLNTCADESSWPTELGPYDLVIMAEVIEHLHIAPTFVLRFLHGLIADGGTLVLQTPNAVRLTSRVKMLLGRNTLEPIREDSSDPGHFHEYTSGELLEHARNAGFEAEEVIAANYFDYSYRFHAGYERRPALEGFVKGLLRLTPKTMRAGLTLVLRKT